MIDATLLAQLRQSARQSEYPDDPSAGACGIVSEEVAVRYGWQENYGCYVRRDGIHVDHAWNELPDGRILDVTADQFLEGDDVRITQATDPRYLWDCQCGTER